MIDRDALAAILKAYGGIGEKMPRDLDVALDAILFLIPGEEGATPDPAIKLLRWIKSEIEETPTVEVGQYEHLIEHLVEQIDAFLKTRERR